MAADLITDGVFVREKGVPSRALQSGFLKAPQVNARRLGLHRARYHINHPANIAGIIKQPLHVYFLGRVTPPVIDVRLPGSELTGPLGRSLLRRSRHHCLPLRRMSEFSKTSVLPVALRKPQSSETSGGGQRRCGVTGKYRVGEDYLVGSRATRPA